jgi:hypothetical protein
MTQGKAHSAEKGSHPFQGQQRRSGSTGELPLGESGLCVHWSFTAAGCKCPEESRAWPWRCASWHGLVIPGEIRPAHSSASRLAEPINCTVPEN